MITAIIIDDEKWTRNVIKSFGKWSDLGIELIGEASNGEEGISLITHYKPDIIITDMNMPNIDGIELLKWIKRNHTASKIIVISGYDDFKYAKEAISAKAFDYILKPVDAVELNEALTRCCKAIYAQKGAGNLALKSFEIELTKAVIDHVKEFRKYLQEKEPKMVNERLISLKSLLSQYEEQYGKDYMIGITNSYIMPVIREELMLIIEEEEALINSYNDIKSMLLSEVPFEIYYDKLVIFVNQCLDSFSKHIKKSKIPIAELAQEYINRNFIDDITLASVSKSLYTSKEYLSSVFKQRYQMTVGQYILKLKMEEAANLLRKGISQQEVSNLLSYQDPTYFYKVFKKYYDLTPGEFVKRND